MAALCRSSSATGDWYMHEPSLRPVSEIRGETLKKHWTLLSPAGSEAAASITPQEVLLTAMHLKALRAHFDLRLLLGLGER